MLATASDHINYINSAAQEKSWAAFVMRCKKRSSEAVQRCLARDIHHRQKVNKLENMLIHKAAKINRLEARIVLLEKENNDLVRAVSMLKRQFITEY